VPETEKIAMPSDSEIYNRQDAVEAASGGRAIEL
jgi:hypothetical protein